MKCNKCHEEMKLKEIESEKIPPAILSITYMPLLPLQDKGQY